MTTMLVLGLSKLYKVLLYLQPPVQLHLCHPPYPDETILGGEPIQHYGEETVSCRLERSTVWWRHCSSLQLKPSILQEISKEQDLPPQPPHTKYIHTLDEVILRLQCIKLEGAMQVNKLVTGTILFDHVV